MAGDGMWLLELSAGVGVACYLLCVPRKASNHLFLILFCFTDSKEHIKYKGNIPIFTSRPTGKPTWSAAFQKDVPASWSVRG